jgi:hypothetical protein
VSGWIMPYSLMLADKRSRLSCSNLVRGWQRFGIMDSTGMNVTLLSFSVVFSISFVFVIFFRPFFWLNAYLFENIGKCYLSGF